MTDLTTSTIERARTDIAALRRGLGDLAAWMDTRRRTFPQVDEVCDRLSQLGEFLERLNARLEDQERERAQLEGLFEVSRAVNSSLELSQVLNRAMDVIIQVTRAERGFLMLSDATTGELTFQVARNMDRDTIERPSFEVSRSLIEKVARKGQPIFTTDALRDPRFSEQDSVVSLNLRSILCHPLKVRERVTGVVYVDNRLHIGRFKEADVEALRAFADQAAIAIDNAQLFESVRQKMHEIAALKTFQDDIFASIASGVIATDLEDHITAFNHAAESILAVEASRSFGKSYREILAPLAATPLPRLVESVKRAGVRHVAAEIQSELPARGTVNLSFSVSALKGADGEHQGVTIVVDDLTEKRRLEATREMFRRYVAPAVVDRLPANPNQLKLGGQRQEITIIFSDIRDFTHFSEPLPPEVLVEFLNRYLAIAANAILKYEGTLDKFMGDAVMGIFNAPLEQKDHTLRAAKAALEMQAAVTQLHKQLPKSLCLKYGVGIHTGDAVVGNVGTEQQMNYTAIGDAVNLAKRLQENAAGGQIILSTAAHTRIKGYARANRIARLQVKGRRAMEDVWELVGLDV